MDITEDLRELRDDLFGLGLDDNSSREVRIFFKSRKEPVENLITFEFLSPTPERDIIESFLDVLLKVKESNFYQLPKDTQESSGPDFLKKFGIYVAQDRLAPSIFTLANFTVKDKNDVFEFKLMAKTLGSLLPNWEIKGFEIGVVQKGELEIINYFEFDQPTFGSSGMAGVSGSVGLTGMSGVIGTAPIVTGKNNTEIITYESNIEEKILTTTSYSDYIAKNFL